MTASSRALLLVTFLGACAGQGMPAATAEPVWSRAVVSPQAGSAGLVLEIRNEVANLGTLRAVAAVLDGAIVYRSSPDQSRAPLSVTLSTNPGRHQLCVVAHFQAAAGNDTFLVRAPRLLQLVDGSSTSARLRLEEQLGPTPYATAHYEGGLPYADTTTQPDPAKYESRLDELCGNR